MAQRVVAVVLGIVGLYLNIWHGNPLPFNHRLMFGPDFGTMHWIHSIIGLVLLGLAAWLWFRASRTMMATTG